MEIIICAALLGLITGAIAHSKGRSFFPWWLYGTLLFIVAIIHVLLIKPDQAAARKAAAKLRKCPSCAEMVQAEAVVCRFCQRDLPPVEAPPTRGLSSI